MNGERPTCKMLATRILKKKLLNLKCDWSQASIAKGHPMEAVETYRQTLTKVDFEEGEFQCALQLPEHGFTSFTVDQLNPKEN